MNKKKKTVLIIAFVAVFLGISVAIFFVLTSPKKNYPANPIQQKTLYFTKQKIDLKLDNLKSSEYPLIGISNTVMVEKVENFAKTIDPKMLKTVDKEGSFYKWGNGDNYVIYELAQNTLIFSFEEGISWDEADISSYSFNSFVKKYLDKNWEYKLSVKEDNIDGFRIYYANRLFSDGLIETSQRQNETDYLAFKNGKIGYGKILLTEFFKTETLLPLISSKDLAKYINLDQYPKEIYPTYSTIQQTVLKEVSYLSEDFELITNTLSGCTGDSSQVVYLYKNFSEEFLMPVYKIPLQCQITYKNTKYIIPAIGYVSAVEPAYISTPE